MLNMRAIEEQDKLEENQTHVSMSGISYCLTWAAIARPSCGQQGSPCISLPEKQEGVAE
jgi:hypothetical protein